MLYNNLGITNIKVSKIAMGSEGYEGGTPEKVKSLVDAAISYGINFFDLYNSSPDVRSYFGAALLGQRARVIIQGHICSIWRDGQYERSRDIYECKVSFADLLLRLQTNYIDIGMIHYVDRVSDFQAVFNGPIIKYARQLKSDGVIRHIGISSHNPAVAKMAVETGIVEVLMFSINPAYDMLPSSEDVETLWADGSYMNTLNNLNPEHELLYNTCERRGIAITAMKAFGGGDLLDEKLSPFGVSLSQIQCLHYALTRPAVAAVFGGYRTPEEISGAAGYCDADMSQKDYSEKLSKLPKHTFRGRCMYCGHCAPCSSKIDIASVNKYLELAIVQDFVSETVRGHYALLDHHASECIECGICEDNCPFGVEIITKMRRAQEVFGK